VDQTIAALRPHLSAGDIIIDGGNSNYEETVRRAAQLSKDYILWTPGPAAESGDLKKATA
jgi:6-phosphogluconate dehydrogenase